MCGLDPRSSASIRSSPLCSFRWKPVLSLPENQRPRRTIVLQYERQCLLTTQINLQHDPFTHYLPVEIASRIFTFYVDDSWPTKKYAPLLLAAVCKAWREIAFSTPRIWTSITTLRLFGGCPCHTRIWLPRSVFFNMLFGLHLAALTPRSDSDRLAKLYSLYLGTHNTRWRLRNARAPESYHN
ncbi:hypothetical protein BDZ97DRAFT_1442261 [Flammula alnicola]|nr:hypothetical protein BDZ97DRAFT_1442261 [Flammula alnicola]